ncbi:cysteine dioxygenase family protein [Plastoroseomonas arctica]|uniref:Cysteine dioxygenase n=1 Tax=Plastoroseomonas arctica TaxID=1509237 RepID=A0AAF1KL59_9PROT|nr:cysteine dioxygenase [Plastoroseomonas arctica]MBR0657480.1 cysteine dioxygenase [Plastoroseomonas arctica]
MNASAVPAARAAAIAATLDRVRRIEAEHGITRDAIDAIAAELVALANQAALFPGLHFPAAPPGEPGARRYILSEDADHRFALALNALRPGTATEPHEHTTWVAIAAIEGQELNQLYTRDAAGGPLRPDRAVIVEPGRGLALMPDAIHAIRILGDRPARHLHLYGLALEQLPHRRAFDPRTGAARPFHRPPMAESCP